MKYKDKDFGMLKNFKVMVENEIGYKIKGLGTHDEGEFYSNEFNDLYT